MHYMDANKTAGEKAWRQLYKNATSNIQQVQEATPHKVTAELFEIELFFDIETVFTLNWIV